MRILITGGAVFVGWMYLVRYILKKYLDCEIEHGLPFKGNTVEGIRVIPVPEDVRDSIFVLEDFWRVYKEGAERFPNYYSKARFEIAYRKIKFAKSKKHGIWLLLYIWETLKDKFANRFPDIYENTWLKIFCARHLEVRLIVKKDKASVQ